MPCTSEGAPNTMVGYKLLNSTTEFQEAALTLHSNNHHGHVHDWTLTCAVLDS